MGEPNDPQRKWLEYLGVTGAGQWTPAPAAAAGGDEYGSPVDSAAGKMPNLRLDPAQMQKFLEEQMEKDRKEGLAAVEMAKAALEDARKYMLALPNDEMVRMGYAKLMAEVRKRFPEAADVSQLVKDIANKVPDLKGKLPSKRALMDTVEAVVKQRGMEISWSVMTGKDLMKVATERLLAAYMSELPSGVSVDIQGGVVKLTKEGAALRVSTAAGDVDATADAKGAAVSLKAKDYNIEVTNAGWKDFDPKLRADWQHITDEASQVAKLEASLNEVKAEYEKKQKSGEELSAELTANLKTQEAEFNLRWKNLKEQVDATAKASKEKITASIGYLKKDANDKEAVKAGADLEVDLKAMDASLKAFLTTPSVKAVLNVTASAEKVAAKLEVAALKSGTIVTASFEQALDETKAAIEVMLKDGKTQIAGELKKKADDLTAKLKVVHQTKDLKLAAELEKTLKDVRGSIEVEYSQGKATIKGTASASSTGQAEAKVQIDIALENGVSFGGANQKLSLAGSVNNSGYKLEVAFSMGEPAESSSIQDLIKDVDQQVKELYKLAGDQGIRSLKDVDAVNAKIQAAVAPIEAAAKKVKTLKGKAAIEASFGFSLQGEWPGGGKTPALGGSFNATLRF